MLREIAKDVDHLVAVALSPPRRHRVVLGLPRAEGAGDVEVLVVAARVDGDDAPAAVAGVDECEASRAARWVEVFGELVVAPERLCSFGTGHGEAEDGHARQLGAVGAVADDAVTKVAVDAVGDWWSRM